jgi:hypothetical protein
MQLTKTLPRSRPRLCAIILLAAWPISSVASPADDPGTGAKPQVVTPKGTWSGTCFCDTGSCRLQVFFDKMPSRGAIEKVCADYSGGHAVLRNVHQGAK